MLLADNNLQKQNENVTLEVSSNGTIYAKSQVTDYVLRNNAFSDLSLFDFTRHTYEKQLKGADTVELEDDELRDDRPRRGRKRNMRGRYHDEHPCAKTKIRVRRSAGHRNLVSIVGRWLPRSDDADVRELYCASVLMLLVPWRNVRRDLKAPSETWDEAFQRFEAQCSNAQKYVISGLQYFHECAVSAAEKKDDAETTEMCSEGRGRHRGMYANMLEDDDDPMGQPYDEDEQVPLTLEGLEALKATQISLSEQAYALDALAAGQHAEFLASNIEDEWRLHDAKAIAAAQGEELLALHKWKDQLYATAVDQQMDTDRCLRGERPSVSKTTLPNKRKAHEGTVVPDAAAELVGEAALAPVDLAALRRDQYRAYDIIIWHLEQTLAGAHVPPLRMVLYGEGGTGKSRVIQTVTEAFASHSASFMLVKAAYTGIAASLIDGKTTHVIGHIGVGSEGKLSDDGKRLLQAFWAKKRYLIVDEYSMLAKSFLAYLSRNIGIALEGEEGMDGDASFGGINVILCGDLHQFPPVARSPWEALFTRTDPERDLDYPERILGRKIYEEFTTVVVLHEQMRVTDMVWRDFLVHLRYGRVRPDHLAMLRSLVVGGTATMPPQSLSGTDWANAALVTPRHGVRKAWNSRAARKCCKESGQRLYIVTAEDRVQNRELTLEEQYVVAGRPRTDSRRARSDLPEQIELAIGMKVMVTTNIQTDLDLANGARGEIVDIVLHPDEPPTSNTTIVKLKYVPAYVLVKMARTRASPLEGLEAGVIPVEPARMTMKINIQRAGQKPIQRTVQRRQFPITAAYAFTDYRSQGQTIPMVLIDIKSPPGGTRLSLFNLYVALSRSSGRATIRLLRDFDDAVFLQPHNEELLREDLVLEKRDKETREWWEEMGRDKRT